jgi:hypothetical protein
MPRAKRNEVSQIEMVNLDDPMMTKLNTIIAAQGSKMTDSADLKFVVCRSDFLRVSPVNFFCSSDTAEAAS